MPETALEKRYNDLAAKDCCLSCGGATDHAHPGPGEVCVDLGSGRGTDTLRLAEAVGAGGEAWGFDLSAEMVAKAEKQAAALGIRNARFRRTDFARLELPDGAADLVISNCAINHAPDKQAVWKEIFRVLKPGGRFAVSDIYAVTPVPEKWRASPEAVAECWAGAVTRQEYLSQVAQAGFRDFEILEESSPYRKGEIEVCSFTLRGTKKAAGGCCCCH